MGRKIIAVVFALAAAAGIWFYFQMARQRPLESEVGGENAGSRMTNGSSGRLAKAREQIDAAAVAITNRYGKSMRRIGVSHKDGIESTWVDEDGNPWPEAQKALMRTIISASEEGDFKAVAELSSAVAKCKNADLRENYVHELGWFGEQAFVDLTAFLSDPSEDVSDAARTHIVDAFQEIESDAEKAALFTILARGVSDSDLLESLSDELFAMDEVLALQAIATTLEEGTSRAKKAALAAYEMITDEEWQDIDSAEAWLSSNYHSDELNESQSANSHDDYDKVEQGGPSLEDGADSEARPIQSDDSQPIEEGGY